MTLQYLEPYKRTATTAETHLFQKFIGSAIYPTVLLHLDTAYPANRLSRYLQNPSPEHRSVANKVLKYLVNIKQRGIFFDGEYQRPEMEVFTDASFADDSTDRKSSQGYIITLYRTLIAWRASKQPTVTTSSTEAELLALTEASKEAIATIRLFAGMRFHYTRASLFGATTSKRYVLSLQIYPAYIRPCATSISTTPRHSRKSRRERLKSNTWKRTRCRPTDLRRSSRKPSLTSSSVSVT